MAKNDPSRPEEARAAQDVDDVPEMLLPEGPRTVGRGKCFPGATVSRVKADTFTGGAANVHRPTDEERIIAQKNNERLRQESAGKDKSKESGIKALARSGKDLLLGRNSKESVTEESET